MQSASDLAARLAEHAEAVCRHYLPAGHPAGSWIVMTWRTRPVVALCQGQGDQRRWQDARAPRTSAISSISSPACAVSPSFAPSPKPALSPSRTRAAVVPASRRNPRRPITQPLAMGKKPQRHACRPLFARARHPLRSARTGAALSSRLLLSRPQDRRDAHLPGAARRDHRAGRHDHRRASHLADPAGAGKLRSRIPDDRWVLLGNGVRFGFGRPARPGSAAGGAETMLSLATVMPELPSIAATSANHLAPSRPTRLRAPLHRGRCRRSRPPRHRASRPPRPRGRHARARTRANARGLQRRPAPARSRAAHRLAAAPARCRGR